MKKLHHLFRRVSCHLSEYAVLRVWLVWRAVRKPAKGDARPWNWAEAGLSLAVVFAYAASDELHQVFVPNRTALVSDVMIDTAGGAVGLALLVAAVEGVAGVKMGLNRRRPRAVSANGALPLKPRPAAGLVTTKHSKPCKKTSIQVAFQACFNGRMR